MAPVNEPHWIIHLPTTLTRLDEVAALAMALRRSLGHVLAIDFGEATLSEEDRQFLRTRVWCDQPMPGGGRCARRSEHLDGCSKVGDVVEDSARQASPDG
ncbi:hypothetical protein ABT346_13905 [Micromonospora peucetia]|uniref:hypothetical protein n=1 Tax=Micromonospora peucetia TaxID=47871 RepID=UPI00332FBBC6